MSDWNFHCGILGVSLDAGEEEIRAAYRETAKLIHPDRHNQSEAAKRRFQQLNVSYKYLLDEIQTKEMPRPRPPVAVSRSGWMRPLAALLGSALVILGILLVWGKLSFFPSSEPTDSVAPAAAPSPGHDGSLSLSPALPQHPRKKRAR